MRVVHAKAPCRICDIGGWTDTRFAEYGAVFSIAVWPGVEVTMEENLNYPAESTLSPVGAAVLKVLEMEAPSSSISVQKDMRPRSGTGTSAAIIVAVIAALDKWRGGHMGPALIATAAHRVEAEELGIECGIQDHLAAAFGGVRFYSISEYPLFDECEWFSPNLMQDRLILAKVPNYGEPRYSSDIHKRVIDVITGPNDEILDELRRLADRARAAYERGGLYKFGQIMSRNTEAQSKLDYQSVAPFAGVINEMRMSGAVGCKVNGAGGPGGTITILAESSDHKTAIEKALRRFPVEIIDFTIAEGGVETWET